MAGQLGQVTVNIADNLMVGRLGTVGLSALSLALTIYVIFFVATLGFAIALHPIISKAVGASDDSIVPVAFKHSLALNMLFTIACCLLYCLIEPIIWHLGQDPEVVVEAIPYLRVNMLSLFPLMAMLAYRGLSEGLGQTRPPMIAMLLGNVVNVVLNYLLIFGHFGFPAYGVEGAAIGTIVARAVMLVSLVLILYRWPAITVGGKKIREHLSAVNWSAWSSKQTKKLLKLGLPTSLQMLFELSAFAGAALLMGMISKECQAAHQITINAITVTFMLCMGLSIAASIRVGNALGEQDKVKMRKAGISAVYQVLAFMTLSGIVMILFRMVIPTFYINEPEVIAISASLFFVAALFQLSDGVQVTAISALRGLQDVVYPTWVTFIAYILIGLPFSYFAGFHWGLGYMGIWYGLLIGLTISAILNVRRFLVLTRS